MFTSFSSRKKKSNSFSSSCMVLNKKGAVNIYLIIFVFLILLFVFGIFKPANIFDFTNNVISTNSQELSRENNFIKYRIDWEASSDIIGYTLQKGETKCQIETGGFRNWDYEKNLPIIQTRQRTGDGWQCVDGCSLTFDQRKWQSSGEITTSLLINYNKPSSSSRTIKLPVTAECLIDDTESQPAYVYAGIKCADIKTCVTCPDEQGIETCNIDRGIAGYLIFDAYTRGNNAPEILTAQEQQISQTQTSQEQPTIIERITNFLTPDKEQVISEAQEKITQEQSKVRVGFLDAIKNFFLRIINFFTGGSNE